ncbi:Glycoside Hydrolase Family 18 protein [Tuber magnatum]|uniref:chitinase n=1 Tax=Tuber magnatum TaxID=42249 RepID=A0A317SCZ8_9PEZI|nr:Glycoside Hydrolase Family 18 protein [Tuber magnatum]
MFSSIIITSTLCLASVFLSGVHAAALPVCGVPQKPVASTGGKTVAYFGQLKSQPTDSLAKFCADSSVDIIVLGFVHIIRGKGELPGLNLSGYCADPIEGTDLIHCPDFGAAITECQAQGKLVLLSLQGSSGTQTLSNDTAACEYADNLWKLFGEGTGLESKRPFGNATVDGFDIDNESGDSNGWPRLISELRDKFTSASKRYYISAAPQCPRPDKSIGSAVYLVDFLFIQFYNNYCAGTGLVSSFNDWSADIAAKGTAGTKLFAGFLGSSEKGTGYATHSEVIGYVSQIKNKPNFGGVATWDASCANNNMDPYGRTFLKAMKDSLQ